MIVQTGIFDGTTYAKRSKQKRMAMHIQRLALDSIRESREMLFLYAEEYESADLKWVAENLQAAEALLRGWVR